MTKLIQAIARRRARAAFDSAWRNAAEDVAISLIHTLPIEQSAVMILKLQCIQDGLR
jgi:hypothetical protein